MLKFIAKPVLVTWLRAHSTVMMVQTPPNGHYSISVHRYPRLGDIPEVLGVGQGYVQLYDRSTGSILQDQVADDLASINLFAWGPSTVTIKNFAEWEVPGGYQAAK